jgi:hypothetical protein
MRFILRISMKYIENSVVGLPEEYTIPDGYL